MLLSDPKWGNGCIVLIAAVGGLTLLSAIIRNYDWTISFPPAVGRVVGFFILLAIARFILNQIFD